MGLRKKPLTKEEAQLKMAGLCSRSEYCEFEIRCKLFNLGLNSIDIEDIISNLIEEKFIDNRRYAGSFSRDKVRFSYWGPLKIRAELSLRRITSSIISEALNQINEEEWENALLSCAQNKAKSLSLTGDEGYKDRKKLFTYLIGRGFTSSQANHGVRLMRQNQEKNKE